MNDLIVNGHSALEYAEMACDALMHKFAPEDLPPKGRFHYHQGVFLSGVQHTYLLDKNEKYYDYAKAWVDSIIDKDGNITKFDTTQLDDMQPGVLLYLFYNRTKDPRYKKALDTLIPLIKDFPKNPEGGFWHKGRYPEQMWLDGLYMAGPICAEYAKTFDDPELFDLCAFQALMMQEKTKDEKTGLWYHAWDYAKVQPWADPETGRSPEFWGRSVGWVPVAVLEELDSFPEDHKDRDAMISAACDLLKAVVKYQDPETGLWYQVLDKGDDPKNWLESSCTCLFVGAICKAVKNGFLDESYLEYAKKGYTGIINRLRYDDKGDIIIDNICVGTGVGDYDHYCARGTGENDLHGAGAFLIMCTEAAGVL